MIGGIGNSMILGNFDSTFAAHPEMALYIPLIGGTGGNVGTQSSAIIVQGLANSSLDAKNTFKQITKESVVALINATIISLLVYTYNFIRFGATATVTYSVSISCLRGNVRFYFRDTGTDDAGEVQNRSSHCNRSVYSHYK